MNMIETTIENEDFDLMYEEDSFKSKKRKTTKEWQEMSALYESTILNMPKNGQVVCAEFQGRKNEVYVFSVNGFKDDIHIDKKPSESKYLKNAEIGDMIDVIVMDVNHDKFYIKGSISSLYESIAHKKLKSLSEGESVKAEIISINPAGYDVEILHGSVVLPAFMPNTLAGINKLYDPQSIIGEIFDVMIESYAEKEGTYIVSRRKYLKSLIPEEVKKLSYEQSYTGSVTGTTPFGVFVEFNNCLTGMIHKANINPEWQDKLQEIKPGFQIVFYVKEIIKDRGNHKIILTQILRETLWDTISNGEVIDGTIKAVKPFGTLVNLDEETVGLIHTSEMDKINRKFSPGDKVKVKVLAVDRMNRKIFLTTPK
jgi:ribosomal protein S1